MICSSCKRDGALHIGHGVDMDGQPVVLCDGCAEWSARVDGSTRMMGTVLLFLLAMTVCMLAVWMVP